MVRRVIAPKLKSPKKTDGREVRVTRGGKKFKKARAESYKIYLHRILNELQGDLRVSKRSMSILNTFINHTFERIITTAKQLTQISNLPPITSREIQSAVYLVVPGDLAKHAVAEGRKAVERYAPGSREDKGLNREAVVEGTKAVAKV